MKLSCIWTLVVVVCCASGVAAQDAAQGSAAAPTASASSQVAEDAPGAGWMISEAMEVMALERAADEAATRGTSDAGEADGWTGSWRSFWRGGQALLVLEQAGSRVTGTYQPGEGSLSGTLEGTVLRGTWSQPGSTGRFEFALAPDAQSFVGRSGNGEYWNGERLSAGQTLAAGFGQDTPRAALISLLSAFNAAVSGDSYAELEMRRYLAFLDGEEDLRSQNARIAQVLRLLDLSTFRALDAPERGVAGRATFAVGPAGTDWAFPIEFVDGEAGWRVVVPPLEIVEGWNAELLATLGFADFDELAEARQTGPRQTVRAFLTGTATWSQGGQALVLSTLDLSRIPPGLRSTDGTLAAEYIREIIDRVGYIIWQELPDDPDQRLPYILYEHALGDIAVGRYPQQDGTVRWLFTAESLAAAPDIYDAVRDLPLAEGVLPTEPLTRAFWLRNQIRDVSPRLLERAVLLETWQWIALGGALLLVTTLSSVVVRVGRAVSVRALRLFHVAPDARGPASLAFGWPAWLFAAGGLLTLLLREIGLRQDVSVVFNGLAMLQMLLGGTFFLYRLVEAVTAALTHPASKTLTRLDDIAVQLGGGLAKVAVLVGGVVLAADVLGLPYEGVIAGLGVGGLAFAIASKDAVANFIGAGILMSDRSFKRGDLIEGGGLRGVVEDVGMRSTRLRTPDGTVVVVPNVKLADGNLYNWGPPTAAGLGLSIVIAADTPRATVDAFAERLRETFAAQPRAQPGAVAALDGIGPASLAIKLAGSFEAGTDVTAAKHKLLGDVVDLAREMGVEFGRPPGKAPDAES